MFTFEHATFPRKIFWEITWETSVKIKMAQSKEAKDSDRGLTWTHHETLALIRVWSDTEIPESHIPAVRWMAFQLPVNRQVGLLWITLLWRKLHRIETGIV